MIIRHPDNYHLVIYHGKLYRSLSHIFPKVLRIRYYRSGPWYNVYNDDNLLMPYYW